MLDIILVKEQSLEALARLRCKLWPDGSFSEHLGDVKNDLCSEDKEAFLALHELSPVGFIELSLRSIVDGCESSPVGYIEGWYVLPEFRGQKIGKTLIETGEEWARKKDCLEIGSDSEIHNEVSILMHKALGFEEVDRVVQFRKSLK